MKIKFVTLNTGKFEWAQRRLQSSGIELLQEKLELDESQHVNVEEVARKKAESIKMKVEGPFIVEDSGFCIETLNNFPATHIKFALSTIGIEGILKLMSGEKNRKVNFKSALVYHNSGKENIFVCDDVGTLSEVSRGENLRGFNELFKIFIPTGFNKTLAEMSDEEFAAYEKGVEKDDHYVKFARWFNENKNEI